jgi:hypothetical protein
MNGAIHSFSAFHSVTLLAMNLAALRQRRISSVSSLRFKDGLGLAVVFPQGLKFVEPGFIQKQQVSAALRPGESASQH